MVWVLLAGVGVLAAVVLALGGVLLRTRGRLSQLESRLESRLTSSDTDGRVSGPENLPGVSLEEPGAPEFVITRVGEPEPVALEAAEPARVDATLFTDTLLKETVVQTASLVHGLRRALAPETRNRIRFHMRTEVKRSRRQRRTELRDVRREWAARQRAEMATDPAA